MVIKIKSASQTAGTRQLEVLGAFVSTQYCRVLMIEAKRSNFKMLLLFDQTTGAPSCAAANSGMANRLALTTGQLFCPLPKQSGCDSVKLRSTTDDAMAIVVQGLSYSHVHQMLICKSVWACRVKSCFFLVHIPQQ